MRDRIVVAMATYNGEKYITRQLESIMKQSRKVDAVYIMDDCSSDRTVNIIDTFIRDNQLAKEWQLYINQENCGVITNFYNVIAKAEGNIIVFSDQDDEWDSDYIESIEQIYQKNPKMMALNVNFRYIDGDGVDIKVARKKNKSNNNLIRHRIEENQIEKIPFPLVFNKNISPGATMSIRKEIQDIFVQMQTKNFLHDWECNCIAAAKDGLYFWNKSFVRYRIHENQSVSIGNIKKQNKKNILLQKCHRRQREILRQKKELEYIINIADIDQNIHYINIVH